MSITRSALRVALLTAFVLLVPLVAMQLTDGVVWSVADFVLAGVLLAGTGVLYELALRRPGSFVYRAIATVIGVAAIVAGEADDAPGTRRVRRPGGSRHDRAGGETLPGHRIARTRYPKSSALASRAPSTIASSFAHSTRESVRIPQSVPAMTFSAPTAFS